MQSVRTLADLRTTPTAEDRVVALLGVSSPGDGGGGEFHWDSTSTATEDSATVVVSTYSASGRWRRLDRSKLDVRWFGARATGESGVAIDPIANQQAIQRAIAAGAAAQRKVYAPAGTYPVYPGLNMYVPRLTLEGDGAQWAGTPGTCFKVTVPDGQPSRIPYAVRIGGSVSVSDVWFDGSFVVDNTVEFKSQCSGCTFSRVIFSGALPKSVDNSDLSVGNLMAVCKNDLSQIDLLTFNSCVFGQDMSGAGGLDSAYRGKACVANIFSAGSGNTQAFRWTFQGHCRFTGMDYGFRAVNGSAAFHDCDFYNMGVALFRLENANVDVDGAYTEPGQAEGHYTNNDFLIQEGHNGGKITVRNSQCNTVGADVVLNGGASSLFDNFHTAGDITVVLSDPQAPELMTEVARCQFTPGKGIIVPQGFTRISRRGNACNGVLME